MLRGAVWASVLCSAVSADHGVYSINDGTLVAVCGEGVVRVVHAPPGTTAAAAAAAKRSLVVNGCSPTADVTVTSNATTVTIRTAEMAVAGEKATGRLDFFSADGALVWSEEGPAAFTPTQDMGEPALSVAQSWTVPPNVTQGWYGGGQYQNGFVDYTNAPVQMAQFNTEAVVPFFLSTSGFGVYWDNAAWSELNPASEAVALSPTGSGAFKPSGAGRYCFAVTACPGRSFGCGNVDLNLTLTPAGGSAPRQSVLEWINLANSPAAHAACVDLTTPSELVADYAVLLTASVGQRAVQLHVRRPEQAAVTTLRSDLGDLVDYFVTMGQGRSFDEAVAGYRRLTGAAPLYPRWVYGFWQCKEHYHTQAELLDAVHKFRALDIPIDAVVQDWLYWGSLGWGPHWDPAVYPDPARMVQDLHDRNVHFMVSVWSKFDAKTTFYKQMDAKGWLLQDYYDAWNPAARELFYKFSKDAHFDIGVDALWLDATEPEFYPHKDKRCAAGSANRVFNSFSLETTTAIADGLRRDFPDAQGARVFSLTRSSYAGQQRTGAALWSGDISGTWEALRRQIAASQNFQMSGMPYWSEDIGGFFRPSDQYASPDYAALLTRWFQFGAFTPIFRVHGGSSNTELWNYAPAVMHNINATALALRYRMLPYNYAGFVRTEGAGYTMQRHLAFDFREDPVVRRIADQFMWGPAFLVAPVHTPSPHRAVYFPSAPGGWYDFFNTSRIIQGGWGARTSAITDFPLYVRAGSVVPLGPSVMYHNQRPDAPLEIRVYPGANGAYSLFEDDGVSRAYQAGRAATIAFSWDDAAQTLHVAARVGSFPGMLAERVFNVVLCGGGAGSGISPSHITTALTYTGAAVSVVLA
eukprot:TRINITY_DN4040_c0_g1_i1.p1 TRINITY_DN4040_c0_g1~~TRINITY_DN4040_c0_g1_i1.p1  ORF type:complete len:863 (+),score=249.28 TRINITY_DN4040_c0_g1_i1:49-2637(+)